MKVIGTDRRPLLPEAGTIKIREAFFCVENFQIHSLRPDIDPEDLSSSRKVTKMAGEKTTRELGLARRAGTCDGSQNRSMRRPKVFEERRFEETEFEHRQAREAEFGRR